MTKFEEFLNAYYSSEYYKAECENTVRLEVRWDKESGRGVLKELYYLVDDTTMDPEERRNLCVQAVKEYGLDDFDFPPVVIGVVKDEDIEDEDEDEDMEE